jgi:hypothetical protein
MRREGREEGFPVVEKVLLGRWGVVDRRSNPGGNRGRLNIWARTEKSSDDGRGGVYVSLPGDVCDR